MTAIVDTDTEARSRLETPRSSVVQPLQGPDNVTAINSAHIASCAYVPSGALTTSQLIASCAYVSSGALTTSQLIASCAYVPSGATSRRCPCLVPVEGAVRDIPCALIELEAGAA